VSYRDTDTLQQPTHAPIALVGRAAHMAQWLFAMCSELHSLAFFCSQYYQAYHADAALFHDPVTCTSLTLNNVL